MKKNSMALLLIFALLSLTFTPSISAQTNQAKPTKKEQKAEKVKTKVRKLGLGERVKVQVKLYNETKYKGYVSEAADDYFVIVDKEGNPHKINYTDVDSIGGKNLSTGAKIAIGIGIGAGATILTILLIFASLQD